MRRLGSPLQLSFLVMSLSSLCVESNLTYNRLSREYFPASRENFTGRETGEAHHPNHLIQYTLEPLRDHHFGKTLNPQYFSRGRQRGMFSLYQQQKPRQSVLHKEAFSSLPLFSPSLTRIRRDRGGKRTNKALNSTSSHMQPTDRLLQEIEENEDRETEGGTSSRGESNFVNLREDLTTIDNTKPFTSPNNLCRSMETFLPHELYVLDTCALCYWFIQNKELFVLKWDKVPHHYNNYRISVLIEPSNHSNVVVARVESEALMDSFSGEEGREKWRSCCKAAEDCCRDMLRAPPWPSGYCPPTWDGWQCWPSTQPSTEAKRTCPSYSYNGKAAACSKMATKQCEEDGRWFRLSRANQTREWSNYSSCSVAENVIRRLYVHIAADCLSAATLVPALIIFFSYKQLRVHRITLHKHLFISLLLEATGNIIFRLFQLHKDKLIQENPTWCITLNLLTKYASLTNYMWYLCEGYYLHKLLASAFAEQNSLIVFYLIGWVFPLIPMSIYAGLRGVRNDSARCWIVPINLDWIMYLPPLLALLINIVFLVNIIRILVSKVRATTSNEPSQYRKAVRATMMVVPLFGLQYMVTIYRPPGLGCDWNDAYQYFNNVIEGSTGAVVAIIFCYTNGEVKSLLRRSWERFQERRAPSGTYLGSQAAHSRSFSTVQTTLVDPSPARRTSSVVSVCINSQVIRRSGSSMRGSKKSNVTHTDVDGNNQAIIYSRRSSKQSLSNTVSNSISKSPQLLEELEDSLSTYDEPLHPPDHDKVLYRNNSSNVLSSEGTEVNPIVTFSKNQDEATVDINVGGQYCTLQTTTN